MSDENPQDDQGPAGFVPKEPGEIGWSRTEPDPDPEVIEHEPQPGEIGYPAEADKPLPDTTTVEPAWEDTRRKLKRSNRSSE